MRNKFILCISILLALSISNPVTNASYLVKYDKTKITVGNKIFNVYISEIDSLNTISIKLSSEKLNSLSNVSSLKDKGLQVAINTAYFKPNNGLPLGLVVRDGEIITSPILNRVAFGINKNGERFIGIPKLEGSVQFQDKSLPIFYINQPLFNCEGVTVLTHRYGHELPKLNSNFKFVVIKDNKVINISNSRLYPDKDSYLIITSRLPNDLKEGDLVKLNYNLQDSFKDVQTAVAGGTYLVKDNKLFIDNKEEKFSLAFVKSVRPRTAIGITKEGKILMVVVGSSNIYDEAKIMKKLGCVEAMNFDGGSSTQMKTPRGYVGSRRGVSVFLTVY